MRHSPPSGELSPTTPTHARPNPFVHAPPFASRSKHILRPEGTFHAEPPCGSASQPHNRARSLDHRHRRRRSSAGFRRLHIAQPRPPTYRFSRGLQRSPTRHRTGFGRSPHMRKQLAPTELIMTSLGSVSSQSPLLRNCIRQGDNGPRKPSLPTSTFYAFTGLCALPQRRPLVKHKDNVRCSIAQKVGSEPARMRALIRIRRSFANAPSSIIESRYISQLRRVRAFHDVPDKIEVPACKRRLRRQLCS
jgi:hypothetical protein